MEAAGQQRVVRAEDVAHMGITEVLRHAPRVYASYRKLVRSIRDERPDAAILIDFPDVNFRLARELKRLSIPVIYFVSPQLWAWKRRRLRWVQERVSRMMVIFPFEERFYRARGVEAEFVGHPLAEVPLPTGSREDYAVEHGLSRGKPWIALLPGSRWREVTANLDTMVELAHRFPADYEYILPVASTIDSARLADFVATRTKFWRQSLGQPSTSSSTTIHLVPEAREALHHARASVVASGTATVQAAMIGNPFVVVYRVSHLTFHLAKRLIRYPGEIPAQADAHGNLPIAMVNLIAGRRIIPELVQQEFTARNLISSLTPLLADGPERDLMITGLAEVRRMLVPASGSGSIQSVCNAIEVLLAADAPDRPPKSFGQRLTG